MAGAQQATTLSEAIAEWAAAENAISPAVSQAVRRQLLDFLGVAVAGAQSPVATALVAALRPHATGEVPVVGHNQRMALLDAAMVMGTMAHAWEWDDGHTEASLHVGAVLFPVAMALGYVVDATLEQVVGAVAKGAEVAIRLAMAVHPQLWRRGFHNTPVLGVFGATVTAGEMVRLTREQTVHALGMAGSFAAGLYAFLGTGDDSKRLHPGKAARDGLQCAVMAQAGLTGPRQVFEGRHGFFQAYLGTVPALNPREWGPPSQIARCYLKPYPCCRHLHGVVEAGQAMRRQGIALDEVDRIEVYTYGIAARHDGRRLQSLLDAQLSLPLMAVLSLQADVDLAALGAAVANREHWESVMGRVKVRVDPVLDAAYPRQRPTRVVYHLHGSSSRSWVVSDPAGEPERPLSEGQVVAKFTRLAAPVLGAERAAKVVAKLAGNPSVREILAAVSPADVRVPKQVAVGDVGA